MTKSMRPTENLHDDCSVAFTANMKHFLFTRALLKKIKKKLLIAQVVLYVRGEEAKTVLDTFWYMIKYLLEYG